MSLRRLFPLLALLASAGLGQTTESTLKTLYSQASHGAFVVKPGVEIKAVYGPHRQACVLNISGPVSETELMTIFETSVPPKSRGLKKIDLLECIGSCQRIIEFEHVDFMSGVVGNSQTSEPAATIIFKRKECEKAAENAMRIPFSLKSTTAGGSKAQ